MDFEKIDKNFLVHTSPDTEHLDFYDVAKAPFRVYGLTAPSSAEDTYKRMPTESARGVSEKTDALHRNAAGGRLRFMTDSTEIAISTKITHIPKMPHFGIMGISGFDMYVREGDGYRYIDAFMPPFEIEDGYESVLRFETREMREILIHFPPYSTVASLYVGLQKEAKILPPAPYTHEVPILYYGSSITQGGCASRPGNSYENQISRRFHTNYINLGFSGSALGEKEIAEYIAKQNMSAFIYDYDFNAPSIEHLENTHEKMFCIIREENPDLPIVILSRPKWVLNEQEETRLAIIRRTYENAKNRGDKNVYFLSGQELMKLAKENGTVDSCHPNDWGFYSMATVLGDLLEKILFS